MKKWLLIPTIIFPYIILLSYFAFFGLSAISDDAYKWYLNNISYPGIVLLCLFLLSVVCNVIFISTAKKASSAEVVKAALTIKCIHIPFFVLVFIFGLFLGFMFIMTFPLIILLVLVDFVIFWLSNMISIFAIIRVLKRKELNLTAALIVTLICQLFFCADVISMFVFNIKVGRCDKCLTH